MELTHPTHRFLKPWNHTAVDDSHDLPEWMLPEGQGQGARSAKRVGDRFTVYDPKAQKMFALHTRAWNFRQWASQRFFWFLFAWVVREKILKHVKRVFDLVICLSGLPLVLPFMLVAALAIKFDSPGPVIFRQVRVGKWGRRFTCFKFRSMYVDAEARKAELMSLNEADEVVFKMKNDPRVTRVGRIIRKLSIDELPQVFNVIKGDMSLVGPRPPVPLELVSYQYDHFRRLDTIPGLTGLQQISGRSELTFKRWVELDVEYIREQNLAKDIEILLKTIPAVISQRGAY